MSSINPVSSYPTEDKSFIDIIHKAAEGGGNLSLSKGKLALSSNIESISPQELIQFVKDKSYGLTNKEIIQVTEDLGKLGIDFKTVMGSGEAREISNDNRDWKKILEEITLGPKEWKNINVDVGDVPPIPENIIERLKAAFPFNKSKTVADSCALLLMTPKVTVRSLEEPVAHPTEGNPTGFYQLYEEEGIFKPPHPYDTPVKKPYWVLISKEEIPGIRNASGFVIDDAEVEALVKNAGYKIPTLLEYVSCMLLERIKSGKFLYSENYVKCPEQFKSGTKLTVGWVDGKLNLSHDDPPMYNIDGFGVSQRL